MEKIAATARTTSPVRWRQRREQRGRRGPEVVAATSPRAALPLSSAASSMRRGQLASAWGGELNAPWAAGRRA
ncbi:hypothetical protein E2562_010505 [Oryza meyeriana var. granulata]|uniref:Uncharacterized protein n=1 Tax=Oryza meyeriana var. granulata TaxID=110450 RepID=A0A6G1DYA2_9ORYZ|nr:hypothetical protein E2562_010505 [Oryza meyeriana var. granulata]